MKTWLLSAVLVAGVVFAAVARQSDSGLPHAHPAGPAIQQQDNNGQHRTHQKVPSRDDIITSLQDSLLNRLDENKDGKLSVSEAMGDATLLELFGKLDADGDGFITRQELNTFRQHVNSGEM